MANNSNNKATRAPFTSSFFGNHVAAARKISNPPNKLQPSQSQDIIKDFDRDDSSDDEDLVLPRHMQDEEDESSEDQTPDPRFEKSFIAPSSSVKLKNNHMTSGKTNVKHHNNNDVGNNSKGAKVRSNPFEAGLDEETQILPLNTINKNDCLSSDNNQSNCDEDDDEDEVYDEDNGDNNTSGDNKNYGDDRENEQGSASDEDLFGTQQQSVKIVSTKTGDWTDVRYILII